MGVPAMDGISEFIHNMTGRWLVGITHAKVNDIFPASTRRRF